MTARMSTNGHSPEGDSTPPDKRIGPDPHPGRRQPPQTTTASVQRRPYTAAELAAWGAAVAHLHRAGLPAAVPPLPAAWLRHHGTRASRADWVSAA